VDDEVQAMLQGQSVVELESLQEQMEAKMRSGTAQVVEYWEAVLKRLHIYKAKARLREIHADLLRQHLQYQRDSDEDEDRILKEEVSTPEHDVEKAAGDWEECRKLKELKCWTLKLTGLTWSEGGLRFWRSSSVGCRRQLQGHIQ
jgi:hypothetical protein